jgi:large subunit ribosomal protein L24
MKIRKGDQVKMIAGKDRGKQGKVLHVDKKTGRASVEGLNLIKKHRRPKKQGEKGQRVEIPAAVDVSNIKLICPQCGKPTRVGYAINEKKKNRVCKKCKAEI